MKNQCISLLINVLVGEGGIWVELAIPGSAVK